MGDVIVKLSVNKKSGDYNTKVLSHEDGASCGDGIDEDIIQDLLNAEIYGFGELAIAEDSGHTCEYYEEKQPKVKAHNYMDNEEDDSPKKKKSNKDLDLGFGV
jgi:hypothetical protein